MKEKKVSIDTVSKIRIVYNQSECSEKEPLFFIHRFGIRKIELICNEFNDYAHCFLISGDAINEKIIICLLENTKGEIHKIKACRNVCMDREMAGYIIKATINVLKVNYDFSV